MANLSDYFPDVSVTDVYTPTRMVYDGSSGYYSASSFTSAGNFVTLVFRFRSGSFTSSYRWIGGVTGATPWARCYAAVGPSDAGTVDEQGKLVIYGNDNTNTAVFRLVSTVTVTDGENHTVFFSYNATTGAFVYKLDGVDADNASASSRVATTGTLDVGAASAAGFGAQANGSNKLNGQIGFIGYDDQHLTNWSDFMYPDGSPKKVDETTWSAWGGSQPLFWNEHGFMEHNKGSAGDMTKNGTIDAADESVFTTGFDELSVATADAYDIRSGKTAGVGNQLITGDAYYPAMLDFNGTKYFDDASVTRSGNKLTVVVRFKRASYTGNKMEVLVSLFGSPGNFMCWLQTYSNDWSSDAAAADYVSVWVRDTSGTTICNLWADGLLDGEVHTLFFSFDGDAGAATFIVDGVNVDETGHANRIAPTTGTLATSAVVYRVGCLQTASDQRYWSGELGFCGLQDAYLTNWNDFMHSDGRPKALDESTWTEWGSQPLYWSPYAQMDNNLGSQGNMNKTGSLFVGDGGST